MQSRRTEIFITRDGQRSDPFSRGQLQELVAKGLLKDDDTACYGDRADAFTVAVILAESELANPLAGQDNRARQPNPLRPAGKWPGLLGLDGLCFVLGLLAAVQPWTSYGLGTATGNGMALFLFGSIPLWGSKPASAGRIITCVIIVVGMSALASLGRRSSKSALEDSRQQSEKAVGSLLMDLEQVRTVSTDPFTDARVDPTPVAQGPAGVMEGFCKDVLNRMNAVRMRYTRGLDEIGWSEVFAPSRLGNDPELTATRRMLREARRLAREYRREALEVQTSVRTDILSLALSDRDRQSMLRDYDSTRADGIASTKRMCDLEDAVLMECENIIDRLEHGVGWSVTSTHIMFNDSEDLIAFNVSQSRISEYVRQQQELQERMLNTVSSTLKGAVTPPNG